MPLLNSDFWMALVTGLWWLGGAIFYGRFYVQWIVSEFKRRSVVPAVFWYMSAIGSVMLLSYNVYTRQPGAAFGQSFNMIVYARNLVHIWRKKGQLSRALSFAIHAATALIVILAVSLTAHTWWREYLANRDLPVETAKQNWMFLGIWAVGQSLFFLRFLIQWIVSELKKESVVPPIFWYLSVFAAVLQGVSFVQRQDWLNSVGMFTTLIVYVRNIALLKKGETTSE